MEFKNIFFYLFTFAFGIFGGYMLFHQTVESKTSDNVEYIHDIIPSESYPMEPKIISINFIERNGKIINPKTTQVKKGEKIYSFFVPAYYPEYWGKSKFPKFSSNAKVSAWGDAWVAFSTVSTDTVSENNFNLVKTITVYDEDDRPEELNESQEFVLKK